mmetsp:Transcript_20225/g.24916  ORF Transcript_20225/g.24916 Transcript_20225/m.24916 type:complete len:463 (+) Transcript_20225:529-1917(+)
MKITTCFSTTTTPNNHHNQTTNETANSSSNSISTSKNTEQVQEMRKLLELENDNDTCNNSHSHNEKKISNNAWDALWKKKITPWDIGKPTPVLQSELEMMRLRNQQQKQQQHSNEDDEAYYNRRIIQKGSIRSLIPGCGGGYDCITIAKHHELVLSSIGNETYQSRDDTGDDDHHYNHDKNQIHSIVIGLDISSTSLAQAKDKIQFLMRKTEEEQKHHDVLDTNDKDTDEITTDTSSIHTNNNNQYSSSSTSIKLMHGDFFKDESAWSNTFALHYTYGSSFHNNKRNDKSHENSTMSQSDNLINDPIKSTPTSPANRVEEKFDFIFDYTFFCALPPELRPQWGEQMSKLIHPKYGKLLTLMFPISDVYSNNNQHSNNDGNDSNDGNDGNDENGNNSKMEGPPFPVTLNDYKRVLEPHGFEIMKGSPYKHPETVNGRKGKELVCWWKLGGKLKSSNSNGMSKL